LKVMDIDFFKIIKIWFILVFLYYYLILLININVL
jgi:hypothetical protein